MDRKELIIRILTKEYLNMVAQRITFLKMKMTTIQSLNKMMTQIQYKSE